MKKTKKKLEILKRLGTLIDEAHVSQAGIARQMGTSPALISRWKNGDITPSMESYEKFCKILNADVDWLLTGVTKLSNEVNFNAEKKSEEKDIILKQQREIVELYRTIYRKDEQIILMLMEDKHSKKNR